MLRIKMTREDWGEEEAKQIGNKNEKSWKEFVRLLACENLH